VSNFSKSEKEIFELRKQKISFFNELSSNSFPTSFEGTVDIENIITKHKDINDGEHTGIDVSIKGRILQARSFGKLSFFDLLDNTGKIQLLIDKSNMSKKELSFFENYDSGDIIGALGEIMKTKKGELSIKVKSSTILSKSLKTLPEKWHGLKDKETRFRQRYLDFIVNPDSKKTIETRSKIINLIRNFMESKGFIEVETPILQPKAGGAIAKPFTTHHNALDIDMFLRIAPELYLKRLIVGGFEKVFELGKVFRNEGIDQTHSPEFTMMESYEAYVDVTTVMDMVENMSTYIFDELGIEKNIKFMDIEADFSGPWKRVSMYELVSKKFKVDIKHDSDIKKVKRELKKNLDIKPEAKTVGLLVYELFENYIEDDITSPTFVTDYPVEVSPFARENKKKPGVTERFELFAFGSELANGFSELIDSEEQEDRLKAQAQQKAKGDEEAHVEDQDYVEALQYGLPPTGGLGFGVDRFVMILTNNISIREVLAFPHLKPEN
jgi:lysyl-tRNA synthetase class 2|tara:strand:+ start:2333 stop:3820 length:1488 start_codon:yes stop_codon:yes gene_type:complete